MLPEGLVASEAQCQQDWPPWVADFLTARHEQKAEEVAQAIREEGGEAIGLSLDVKSMENLERF
ncbi:MAG: hypothetical protein SAMD01599839_23180 [Rectinema sp.]